MRKFITVISACLLTCTFSTCVFADDDVIDASGEDRKQTYHVFEDVYLTPTTTFQYYKPRIVIKNVFPKIETETLDDNIDTLNELIDNVTSEKADEFREQVNSYKAVQNAFPKDKLKNDLTIDFDTSIINTNDIPLVSIRFTVQGIITGMAHPYHQHFVVNYNLDTGNEIELADLFDPDSDYLNVIADYCRTQLSRKLPNPQMVSSGTQPLPDNYKNWNISPYGLLFTFDEAQVAPYVYGTQSVLVPYSALKDIVAKESPIYVCIKHRRRCTSNRVLTGGFVDEAANGRSVYAKHSILNPRLRQA